MTLDRSKPIVTTEIARVAAEWLKEQLLDRVRETGKASLALSGGATPREVHAVLATLPDVPWSTVHVYFGDERCVPPDHPDSNYRMAKESLLDRVPIPENNVHRPHAEATERDAAARAYEAELPDVLDVVVLGIGEDGHTASLFPGSPALAESTRRYVAVTGPKPPPERLSLTPVALAAAGAVLVLARGEGKAEAVMRALDGEWDPKSTPAQLVRTATWILDPSAAARLTEPEPA
jgi:6-phosphogluconolactonase